MVNCEWLMVDGCRQPSITVHDSHLLRNPGARFPTHCLANVGRAGDERLSAAIIQEIEHGFNFRPHAAGGKVAFLHVLAQLNGRNLRPNSAAAAC
jgi:hypothetical protein